MTYGQVDSDFASGAERELVCIRAIRGELDVVNHLEVTFEGDNCIDERYRIAWVELNSSVLDVIELTVSILANRDLPGRMFPTVDAAREWLFKNNSAQ